MLSFFASSSVFSYFEYSNTPPITIAPPTICCSVGTSAKMRRASIDANIVSVSFADDTKEGLRYFKHQLKIECPIRVENTARHSPISTSTISYPLVRLVEVAISKISRKIKHEVYVIKV